MEKIENFVGDIGGWVFGEFEILGFKFDILIVIEIVLVVILNWVI